MSRNLTIHLLEFCRPASLITQIVGSHVARTHPSTGLDRNDLESRLRDRKRGHATGRAGTDDHDVCLFEVDGHVSTIIDQNSCEVLTVM